MSGREATTGAVVSCTITWKDADDSLPAASSAMHVTVVVPSRNVAPDACEQLTGARARPSSSSAMRGGHEAVAPSGPVASRVMSSGTTVHLGGCGAGLMVKVRLIGSAGLWSLSPSCEAVIVHDPGPVRCTVAP